jgi:glycosyltransferase involved in cell wall biosynthesis
MHDRKDIGGMINSFVNAFKNKQNKPALILKTSGATFSIIDRENIMGRINAIRHDKNMPNIYLIHGDMSNQEMNSLYNHPKIKAMVSLTHGEGYGRPLAEFAAIGKPIIASN